MSVFFNKLQKKVVCIWLVNLIISKLLMLEIMILIFHILVIFTIIYYYYYYLSITENKLYLGFSVISFTLYLCI